MANLKLEILQEPAFSSTEEEAFLNLLRSCDCLERAFQQKIRGWGLTATQYNVLRILGGAHPNGLLVPGEAVEHSGGVGISIFGQGLGHLPGDGRQPAEDPAVFDH